MSLDHLDQCIIKGSDDIRTLWVWNMKVCASLYKGDAGMLTENPIIAKNFM